MPFHAPARGLTTWGTPALLLGYTFLLYLGLGPAPSYSAAGPWQPTGFLRGSEFAASLCAHPVVALAVLCAVPAIGVVIVLRGHSAIAIAIACSCWVTSAILVFYGSTGAFRVWQFFGWRGSWVIALSGLAIGVALASPWLAARWWRLPVALRWLVYVPIAFAVVALIRHVTGTDERLPFNLSPWPAIDVLALEIVVYAIVGLLLGGAVAAGAGARCRRGPLEHATSVALAALVPVAWFAWRFDHTHLRALAIGWVVALGIVTALARIGTRSTRDLEARAFQLGLAAVLVGFPIFVGASLAEGDYAVSRHVRARSIIEALGAHYDEHDEYPDDLAVLVETGRLPELPRPRIGFATFSALGFGEPPAFRYQNLGSSYLLEFAATEWVMCSYSPGWRDIDPDEDASDTATSDREIADRAAHCPGDCGRVCGQDCDPESVGDCDAFCERACRAECEREAGFDAAAPDPAEEAWACPAGRPELW